MICAQCSAIVPLYSTRCQEPECRTTSPERMMTAADDDDKMDMQAFDIYLTEGWWGT